ncbi:MAG: hypothetical protein HY820_22950 [Acidobacteria bacterium]|nr:hypothetical protein [Acidobacteriota bacterium]
MKFYPIPDPRSGAVTPQMLADLQQIGILPRNIGAFANAFHWQSVSPVLPPLEGSGPKFWRDNATLWDQRSTYDYLMLARNADGSYASHPVDSVPNGDIYSLQTVNFYREYGSHFSRIPSFVVKTLAREDAGRLNFSAGQTVDYPIGIYLDNDPTAANGRRATFPPNMAMRFNPQTGQAEAFFVEEYVKAHPLDYTPRDPNAGRRLSDGELVSAVGLVLGTTMEVAKKAAAIRQLAA